MTSVSRARSGLTVAALLTLGMAAVVGGALCFEYLGGYIPCELCLLERKPYYIGAAIGMLTVLMAALGLPAKVIRNLVLLLGVIMLISAGIGIYHAGVEWHFWEGPSACTATTGAGFTGTGDILAQLNSFKGPSCDQAALRIFGVSLAGWNVVASLILAGFAFKSFRSIK
ncbi:disulfide bond formation protein B [Allorhizobium sp. BGMRC 0089]|nr:disulfide bond formation protein B [Allorhizobium sonneratiae]MCM2293527.1 disulfide bond formation protein B [Allorhizobium sonneratiae]